MKRGILKQIYQWNLDNIGEYFENLHSNKLEKKYKKMDKCLYIYDLPNLNQDDTNNINKPITSKEDWNSNKESPNKEKPRTRQIDCWISTRLLKKN
jgi:hypothetical protein